MDSTTDLHLVQKSFVWRVPDFPRIWESKDETTELECSFELNHSTTTEVNDSTDSLLKCTYFINIRNGEEAYFGMRLNSAEIPRNLEEVHVKVHTEVNDKLQATTLITSLEECMGLGVRLLSMESQPSDDIPDQELTVRFTVSVYNPVETEVELAIIQAKHEPHFTKSFCAQMTYLRTNPLNIKSTATNVVSKDGVEFPVDPVILAARSPVFCEMFEPDINKEAGEVVNVKLKHIESKPLEVLLHFIHTGELTEEWKNEEVIEGLYCGAEAYEIVELTGFLEKVLGLVCTKKNCGRLMGLAKRFKLKRAENQLFAYFKKHLANDIDEVLKFAEETEMARRVMFPTKEEVASEESGEPDRKRMRTSV